MRVARLAASQWGVLSVHELYACGLSHDGVWVRVRSGRLHRLHRGVYAVGHANVPLEGRFLAAVKACGPGAVLSHFSAAALWGLLTWEERHPEVTVPGSHHRRPRIKTRRSATLHREDTTHRKDIPVTTPARTILDLSSVLPYKALRRTTRKAQSLGLVSHRQLTHLLDTPTRSELEDAVLDLIVQGGLEPPQVNAPLRIDGQRIIPDLRWPAQRLVVEADGVDWHDNPTARQDDAERQAILEAHGERVVRVTWDQTIRKRRQTLARLRQAGAPPAR